MEENTATTPWYQDAIKNGLILGMVHILVFGILYYFFTSKLTGFSYLAFIMVLNLGYTIFQGISYRNETGGYIEYGAAFKFVLILLIANGLVFSLFMVIFLIMEPSYPQVMAQSQLDTSIYWAQKFGAPESSLDEIRDKFDFEDIERRYGYRGMPLGLGIALILYILGALITALFIRKRMPETF